MRLAALDTETANAQTHDLDTMSVRELLAVMNAEDRTVPDAVGAALGDIARAVDSIVAARARGGPAAKSRTLLASGKPVVGSVYLTIHTTGK